MIKVYLHFYLLFNLLMVCHRDTLPKYIITNILRNQLSEARCPLRHGDVSVARQSRRRPRLGPTRTGPVLASRAAAARRPPRLYPDERLGGPSPPTVDDGPTTLMIRTIDPKKRMTIICTLYLYFEHLPVILRLNITIVVLSQVLSNRCTLSGFTPGNSSQINELSQLIAILKYSCVINSWIASDLQQLVFNVSMYHVFIQKQNKLAFLITTFTLLQGSSVNDVDVYYKLHILCCLIYV